MGWPEPFDKVIVGAQMCYATDIAKIVNQMYQDIQFSVENTIMNYISKFSEATQYDMYSMRLVIPLHSL